MTTYFVTGATGFIGRHLVERLLEREGDIYVLVREGSRDKLAQLVEGWGHADRIKPVIGDLTQPKLGVETDLPRIDHFFHLAAVYDMAADEERNAQVNVAGTQNAVDLANSLDVGMFHHTSSIAVAGLFSDGTFTEDMFDEGQKLAHPYHRTKFESERVVRERVKAPLRIYRPSIVVGNSKTGEMDKIDGPYYFFKVMQKIRHALPEWFPLISVEWGWTNIVPVDYVAAAMDHIAHKGELENNVFHIVDPKGQRVGEVLNTFAEAGHAPRAVMRIDRRALQNLPKGVIGFALKLPALKQIRRNVLADLGIPDEVVEYIALTCRFDARDAQRALRDSTITIPTLPTYADKLWDYWERELDPDLYKDRSFEGAVNGKTVDHHRRVERHRPRRGAEDRGRRRHPDPRRPHAREARRGQDRDRGRGRHGVRRPVRPERLRRDRGPGREAAGRPPADRHARQQRGTLDPPQRRALLRPLPRLRAHGPPELPEPGEADARAAPAHARPGRRAHRQRVEHRRADQPAAVQRLRRVQVRARRVHARGEQRDDRRQRDLHDHPHAARAHADDRARRRCTTRFPTISPEEAADLVCEAIRAKPKQINTKLGTFGEVAYALAPKAVDQILHLAYRVFPESTAAKGGKEGEGGGDKASGEATALAYLMKGVHW